MFFLYATNRPACASMCLKITEWSASLIWTGSDVHQWYRINKDCLNNGCFQWSVADVHRLIWFFTANKMSLNGNALNIWTGVTHTVKTHIGRRTLIHLTWVCTVQTVWIQIRSDKTDYKWHWSRSGQTKLIINGITVSALPLCR